MKYIIPSLLTGVMLIGCSSEKQFKDDPASAQQPRQKGHDIAIPATPTYKDIGLLLTTYPDNLRDSIHIARGENQPFKTELNKLLAEYSRSDSKDWRQLDKEVRSLISSHASNPYAFVLRQHAAVTMLLHNGIELLQYEDQPAIEAIAYYTEQLDKANSDAAPLLYFCLSKLKGYWEPQKTAQLAARTLNRYASNSKQLEMINEFRKGLGEPDGKGQANQKLATKILSVEDFSIKQLKQIAGSTTVTSS